MKVVYTLSGGAAYGYAHIGVLEFLEESGLKPDAIVGTSMGAIIGGLYAYGYNAEEIKEISEKVRAVELMRLFFPSFPRGGIIDTDGIRAFFEEYVGETRIEELDTVYRSVAVDIATGEEIVFDRGKLLDGMVASMSIPAVFKPYRYGERYLVDGGVVNNLPWDIAQKYGRAHVVVNVAPRREAPRRRFFTSELPEVPEGGETSRASQESRPQKEESREQQKEAVHEEEEHLVNNPFRGAFQNDENGLGPLRKLREHFSAGEGISLHHLMQSFAGASGGSEEKKKAFGLPEIVTNVMSIINDETELPKSNFGRHYVYLHPDLRNYSLNDFQKASEIISIGYQSAQEDPEFVKGVGRIVEKQE